LNTVDLIIPYANSHSTLHKYIEYRPNLTLRSIPTFMLCWIHCEHRMTSKRTC